MNYKEMKRTIARVGDLNQRLSETPSFGEEFASRGAEILVRNATDEAVRAFCAVEVLDATFATADDFFSSSLADGIVLEVSLPSSSDSASSDRTDAVFGVTQEPIPPGEVGRAVIAGATVARLRGSEATAPFFAVPEADGVFCSADDGPVKIIWLAETSDETLSDINGKATLELIIDEYIYIFSDEVISSYEMKNSTLCDTEYLSDR
ncbi:MAG: hypothetical protein Q4D38_14600, partial [Planctomycetia bacterium]|nr:hypothetical protein [Planctomycetia bacterium]